LSRLRFLPHQLGVFGSIKIIEAIVYADRMHTTVMLHYHAGLRFFTYPHMGLYGFRYSSAARIIVKRVSFRSEVPPTRYTAYEIHFEKSAVAGLTFTPCRIASQCAFLQVLVECSRLYCRCIAERHGLLVCCEGNFMSHLVDGTMHRNTRHLRSPCCSPIRAQVYLRRGLARRNATPKLGSENYLFDGGVGRIATASWRNSASIGLVARSGQNLSWPIG